MAEATKETALVEKSKSYIEAVKKEVVDVVEKKVEEFIKRGELHLPPNYSPQNALKSAWLVLQGVEDKSGKPALTTCTRPSIANALLDMVVQGLSPAKKQCYFIAYGDKLLCQRSYFGTMAVCKNVSGAKNIYAEMVYDGDEFIYEISRKNKLIRKHTQELKNIAPNKIVAAYCTIEFENGNQHTEIMTIAQIEKAWTKSKVDPKKDGSPHKDYPEEMCKRTVINRACKQHVNSSSDSNLFLGHFNRTDEEIEVEELNAEITEHANREIIDIECSIEVEEPTENGDPPF